MWNAIGSLPEFWPGCGLLGVNPKHPASVVEKEIWIEKRENEVHGNWVRG